MKRKAKATYATVCQQSYFVTVGKVDLGYVYVRGERWHWRSWEGNGEGGGYLTRKNATRELIAFHIDRYNIHEDATP